YVFKIRFLGVQAGGDDSEIDPYQYRVAVKAGLHTVGVTSPRENLKAEREAPVAPGGGDGRGGTIDIPSPVDLRLDGARLRRFDVRAPAPDVATLVIGGPYTATSRGDTASRRAIFVCHPDRPAQEPACARTILATLARRRRYRSAVRVLRTRAPRRQRRRFRGRHRVGARSDARLPRIPLPHRARSR